MERIDYRLGERDLVWDAARAASGLYPGDLAALRALLAAGGRGMAVAWDAVPEVTRLMERALAQPTPGGAVITDQGLAVLDAVDTSHALVELAIAAGGPDAGLEESRRAPGARVGGDRRALPRRTGGRRSTDPGSR